MNLSNACRLLDISIEEMDSPKLKKNYKRKCLRFHPDKKGDKEKFIELKQAYDFILNYPKPSTFLDDIDETMLRQYLYSIYTSEIEIFKNPVFIRYFIDPVKEHLSKFKKYELCPSLENLLKKDIYYLEEENIYIPLWHQEITFGGKISVTIHPKLPKNVELDENNNILCEFKDILVFGSVSILITESEKKEKRLIGKGIPRIKNNIYDASDLSDIILISPSFS